MTDRGPTVRAWAGASRGARRVSRLPLALGVLVVMLVVGGCGQEEGPVGSPDGADEHQAQESKDAAAEDAFLFVEAQVRLSDDADPTTRTFACDADGTSFEGGDSDEACAALVAQQSWLLEGDPADQICTQVYGGPEVAQLRGHVDGEAFQRRLDRTDGCGIQRWEQLEAVLGEPVDGHQEPVTE